ncbi:MAG: fused MFS/spermidine synthase [Pigmentiphaga sp.]|nr:fused MFS/spermidine synthase [Pigmentiphaga sp.]
MLRPFSRHALIRIARRLPSGLLATLAALGWLVPAAAQQIIHTEPSMFSPIVVYEARGERCMAFGSVQALGRQTCRDLKQPERLVFQYTQMVLSALWLQPDPQRILIVGLGGGTLPMALAGLFPQAVIDTVEIDPAVLRVARTYFGYRPGERQRIHVADGRAHIEAAAARGEHYDLIILDAFDATYIPPHLMTRQFLETVKQLLSPGGVLAANTFTSSRLYERESATYAAVFGPYYQLRGGNRVILARPAGLPKLPELRTQALEHAADLAPLGVSTPQLLNLLGPMPNWPADTEILSDP